MMMPVIDDMSGERYDVDIREIHIVRGGAEAWMGSGLKVIMRGEDVPARLRADRRSGRRPPDAEALDAPDVSIPGGEC